jgi:hypothetical protein
LLVSLLAVLFFLFRRPQNRAGSAICICIRSGDPHTIDVSSDFPDALSITLTPPLVVMLALSCLE